MKLRCSRGGYQPVCFSFNAFLFLFHFFFRRLVVRSHTYIRRQFRLASTFCMMRACPFFIDAAQSWHIHTLMHHTKPSKHKTKKRISPGWKVHFLYYIHSMYMIEYTTTNKSFRSIRSNWFGLDVRLVCRAQYIHVDLYVYESVSRCRGIAVTRVKEHKNFWFSRKKASLGFYLNFAMLFSLLCLLVRYFYSHPFTLCVLLFAILAQSKRERRKKNTSR